MPSLLLFGTLFLASIELNNFRLLCVILFFLTPKSIINGASPKNNNFFRGQEPQYMMYYSSFSKLCQYFLSIFIFFTVQTCMSLLWSTLHMSLLWSTLHMSLLWSTLVLRYRVSVHSSAPLQSQRTK